MILFIATAITVTIIFILIRIRMCLPNQKKSKNSNQNANSKKTRTVIVFGSGGHTTEMLKLIELFGGENYDPVCFVISNTDKTSLDKIKSSKLSKINLEKVVWYKIQRSREVKQSWLTTILTTSQAFLQSIMFVYTFQPDLIICNGPGTCLPICYNAFMLNVLGLYQGSQNGPKIVFVESFCRVKHLSLTGKLLYPIADAFIVQWPDLLEKYKNAKYIGRIC